MFTAHQVTYILYVLGMVALSALVGGLAVYWWGWRRVDRDQLAAGLAAVEAAPVGGHIVDGNDTRRIPALPRGRLALAPAQPPPAFTFATYLPLEVDDQPGWVTTAATTGDLTYARVNMDLDDFALWLEQGFHNLNEQVRTRFETIRIGG
jgi:hypothetical protein